MFHYSTYKKLFLTSILMFVPICQSLLGASKITDNIKIIGIEYSFKSLAGISEDDLWKEYNTELDTFDKNLQKYLLAKITGNKEETNREKCFDVLLSRMINRIKRVYILADLYEQIIASINQNEEELFDLDAVQRMYTSGTNIALFIKDNHAKFKKPDEAEKTLQLLFQKYNLRNSQKIWRDNLKNKAFGFEPFFHVDFLAWHLKLRKYDKYKNADIKASLVYYLVLDYCKKGRYFENAKHSSMTSGRVYESVKINAYQGNSAYISGLLLEVMDDKSFIKRGLYSFNKWIELTGIPIDLKINLVPVNQDVNYSPKLGVVDHSENIYSIIGLHPHSSDTKYPPEFLQKISIQRAIMLCVSDLLSQNLSINEDEKKSLTISVSEPGIRMISLGAKPEEFIKSSIPSPVIELIIDNSVNLHNLASAAAIADLSSNRKLATETYKKCIDISKFFAPIKAKPYLNIIEALEKRFKDLKIDIKSLPTPGKINFETDSLIHPEEQQALKETRLASQKQAETTVASFWGMFISAFIFCVIGVLMGRKMKKNPSS